jgi:hypothetical protein
MQRRSHEQRQSRPAATMQLVLRQGGVGFDFFVHRKTEPGSFPSYAETRSRIAGLRYGAGSQATYEISRVFNTNAELRWAVGYPRVLNRGRLAHDDFAAGSHKFFFRKHMSCSLL